MQTKYFSPSVNILRDKDNNIAYIPTRNGEKAFQKIANSFLQGTKSFNVIGAYGTGKSSFILAFEKVINQKANYFPNPFAGRIDFFDTVFIVGDYTSFKQAFCDALDINHQKDIFKILKKRFDDGQNERKGLLIVADEFGKFLEYAAKESPEDELYFIQQLSEFANSAELPLIFITTLHQPFEEYALALTKAQKKEWEKVKGRLVEVSFNEPVEQLLFLASERIAQHNYPCSINVDKQQKLFQAIQDADVFPLRDYFSFEFAQKLFPFDILAASLMTIAFQRYGQNERSLFYLLDSDDYLGINDFANGDVFYNVPCIFDYLKYNFHSLLNSRFNPDSAHWKALDDAIQRTESVFDGQYHDAFQLIKTIGLVSVLGRQGQKLTKDFLVSYAQYSLGINNPESIIDVLEKKQIIRYRNFSQRYVLFKGTDFDLNLELELAEGSVSKDFSIVQHLKKHFNFPIIPAKRVFYEKGTPRYFAFEISESPIHAIPEGDVDGYINLVFSKFLNSDVVYTASENSNEAILYGWFKEVDKVKQLLIEIEKVQIVKDKCIDDQVAIAELDAYLMSATEELNNTIHNSFYTNSDKLEWYFAGESVKFQSIREFNHFLSTICDKVYSATPRLKNELMNREKISGAISAAKKMLVDKLLNDNDKENLAFDETRFPPEKTIYLALVNRTGIHKKSNNGNWVLGQPVDQSFNELWNASELFLADCAVASRKLTDFIDILKARPFKLKQGFIEFWVQIFLITKQKHFAFYENDVFVSTLTVDTLEVALKQPQKYRISTFNLSENRLNIFNRYRYFLNMIEEVKPDSDSFIETIKPFLVFYKRLVPYTLKTRHLSKDALRLREAISIATDPEKVFFEDIPRALGFTISDFNHNQKLEDFSISLQNATRELSGAFSNLVNRIENVISTTVRDENVGFPENKLLLQNRFKKLKKESIDPKLKVLTQRINTPLDDRQSWISSMATAIVNKPLDQFSDDDEQSFKLIFTRRVHELDNLTDLSDKDVDEAKEEVFKLELTSFVKGVQRNLVRLPKEKMLQIETRKQGIKQLLDSNDKQVNIALLIKLIQEEIENE